MAKPVKFTDLCLAFGAPAPEGRGLESADKRSWNGIGQVRFNVSDMWVCR